MTATYPIVTLGDGTVSDAAWFANITDSANDHETRLSAAEATIATSSASNVDPTTTRTTTSTSFTTTLTAAQICGVAFTAPTSGKVLITWRCTLANSANNYTACSFGIATGSVVGSGVAFLAPDDARTVSTDSSTFEGQGASEYVSGLTSGNAYNVALYHRVVAGTGSFVRRTATVIPLLA